MDDISMLEGQCCIVTGGSRGLGLAICQKFAKEGAKVAFTYSQNDFDADEARRVLEDSGAEVLVFKGSVSDAKHVREVVTHVNEAWGQIDVLVNNAGITQILPIALLEESDWDLVMDINVKGAYLFSRAVLRYMIKKRSGQILNIGNFSSERMIEAPVHYAAAKSALRGLTEALAREVGRYQVKVNLLAPGLLETGLSTMLPQNRLDEYLSQCAFGRLGKSEEVAEMAAFMVSSQNRFMTGAKVVVDGGM